MSNLVADLNTRLQSGKFGEYCRREKVRDVVLIGAHRYPYAEVGMTQLMLSGVSDVNGLRFKAVTYVSDELLSDDDLVLDDVLATIVGSVVPDDLLELAA